MLQRYHKPGLVEAQWFDFEHNELVPMKGRVRLCPYYFVTGDGDAARAELGRRAGHDLPGGQENHSRHDGCHLRALLDMSLVRIHLSGASSLFVIVDPLATVPAFLAMTPNDTPEQRIRMARLACCVAAGVLLAFAVAGKWIFKFLGITMPAFQIAASIVLLLVALDMLRAQRSRVQETSRRNSGGRRKDRHRHHAAGDPDAGRARAPFPRPSCCITRPRTFRTTHCAVRLHRGGFAWRAI